MKIKVRISGGIVSNKESQNIGITGVHIINLYIEIKFYKVCWCD